MKGYINIVYQNDTLYECSDERTRKIFKTGNCYYIIYRYDLDEPLYIGKNLDTKNEFVIGNESKLVEFCARCNANKTFVINGISPSEGLKLFSLVKQERKKLLETDIKNNLNNLDYQTKDYYYAGELIVGELVYASDDMVEGINTKQKYLFEQVYDGKSIKYREIFSGIIAFDEQTEFGKSYVVNKESFVELFSLARTEEISSLDLRLYLDGINYKEKKSIFSKIRKK